MKNGPLRAASWVCQIINLPPANEILACSVRVFGLAGDCFSPIVQTCMGTVFRSRRDISFRGSIGPQPVGNDPPGQPKLLTRDIKKHFAARLLLLDWRFPNDTKAALETSRPQCHLSVGCLRTARTAKFPDPCPDGFIAYSDTALGKENLNVPQAERKAMVCPNRVGNDGPRGTVAF